MSSLFDPYSPLELARLERDVRLLRASRSQAFTAPGASREHSNTAARNDVAARRVLGRLTHLSRVAHRP